MLKIYDNIMTLNQLLNILTKKGKKKQESTNYSLYNYTASINNESKQCLYYQLVQIMYRI